MEEPSLKQTPAEFFGHAFTDQRKRAKQDQATQRCPYIGTECIKPRKSQPKIKVGICSVGYKGDALPRIEPIIVCPKRFEVEEMFRYVAVEYFGTLPRGQEIIWVPNVPLGPVGHIDFVAVRRRKGEAQPMDYVLVETQAAGTTGSPWKAILEFKRQRKFRSDRYNFGINWANEFQKTMMQQAYKKGRVVGAWGKKVVFVVQDVAMAWLRRATDTSGLRPVNQTDTILFYTVKMAWDSLSGTWKFVPGEKLSTDQEGVRRMLAGTLASEQIPEIDFRNLLVQRLNEEA